MALTDQMISREMQMFLVGYILISLCEIFTVGGIPLDDDVRKVRLNIWGMIFDTYLTRASRLYTSVSSLRQHGSCS